MIDKNQFVYNIIIKINSNEPITKKEVGTALSYFSELIANNQFSGSQLEKRTFGGILSDALSRLN